MNNKGFTVVELLASFTLTMVIVVFLFEIVLELKTVYVDTSLKTTVLNKNSVVATTLHDYLEKEQNPEKITGSTNTININGTSIQMPSDATINGFNKTKVCDSNNNCYIKVNYTVKSNYLEKDIPFNYIYTYNGSESGSSTDCEYEYNGTCYKNKQQMKKCDIYTYGADRWCIIGVACGFSSPDNAKASDYYRNNCSSWNSPKICSTVYEKNGSVASQPVGANAGYCYFN